MKKILFYSISLLLIVIMSYGVISTAFADQYNDVEDEEWYYNAVNYVTENNLMTGNGNGSFEPNAPITRGMLVTILYRIENTPILSGNGGFSDVPENSYYATAVAWAAENNITSGTSNNRFSPHNQITREQFAAMLYRYADMKGYDISKYADVNRFSDATQISLFAEEAMRWAIGNELLRGSDGWLSPKGVTTRAQAAEIFMRFIENVTNELSAKDESEQNLELSDMQVKVTSQGRTSTFRLYDTVAAKELYEQLPLELELINFRDAQWMFYPPEKLNVSDEEAYHDGKKGELSYYEPWGDVFMLYEDFYAGDEMHRLGVGVTGIDNIADMSGTVVIDREEVKNKMQISIGEYSFTATLADNSSAQALYQLLADGSITIDMEDYGGFEKVGPLGTSLPTNDEQIATEIGDIILYQGNKLVIYYSTNSWSFTRLGKIEDTKLLKEALGSGNVTVTFSIAND